MTASCICTQFACHMAIDRRVWATAALLDCMEKSIGRNYDSKQKWLNRQVGSFCGKGRFYAWATNFIPKSVFTDVVGRKCWDDFQFAICFEQIVQAVRLQICGRRPGLMTLQRLMWQPWWRFTAVENTDMAPPKTKYGWMKKLNRCFARGFCPARTFISPVVLQNQILPVFYFSFYFLFRTFRIDLKKFSNGKWKMWVNPKDSILGAIVALRSIMHFPENPAADNSCFPATRHKDDSSK